MGDYIQSILLVVVEIVCCRLFYETFGEKRYRGWMNAVQLIATCAVSFGIAYVLSNNFMVRQVIFLVVLAFAMFWYVKISFVKSMLLSVLYVGIMAVVDYVAFTANSYLLSSGVVEEQYLAAQQTIVILFGKAILFFCIILVKKCFSDKKTQLLSMGEWVRFMIFPLFTVSIIAVMLSTFGYVKEQRQLNMMLIIAFGMVGMTIFVFYLMSDIVERDKIAYENKLFMVQVKNQAESFDRQKKKSHEYKNQMICIESLLNRKEYQKAEEYIKKIYGNLNRAEDAVNTNHVMVNAVLNAKYQEAVERGIVFVFRVNDLGNLKLEDADLVTLLSNLLNNAIEACETCTDKKVVKIKFVQDEKQTILAVKNTYHHEIHTNNNEFLSTKTENPDEHGIGIKNVIRIIEKYHGAYTVQYDDNDFLFSIVIPNH